MSLEILLLVYKKDYNRRPVGKEVVTLNSFDFKIVEWSIMDKYPLFRVGM